MFNRLGYNLGPGCSNKLGLQTYSNLPAKVATTERNGEGRPSNAASLGRGINEEAQ